MWRRIFAVDPASPRPARAPDRGTIAVMSAVALVAMTAMAAVVVDGGYLLMRKRSLQAVADAAALAGAYSLPTSATAVSQARASATSNGYTDGVSGATVTVNSPYSGDSQQIEVVVSTSARTFLAAAIGRSSLTFSARAVGRAAPQMSAIFAGDTSCSGYALQINGTGINVRGGVHSNGALGIFTSSGNSFGDTTYVCSGAINPGNTYTSGPAATSARSYPVSYTAADFPCTYTGSPFDVSQPGPWWQSGGGGSAGVLKPGVYCSTGGGTMRLNWGGGSPTTGTVTFVSDGPIQISGPAGVFTGYLDNVVFYTSSTSTSAFQAGTASLTWNGIVFVPNGSINVSGSNFVINGSLIGKRVQLSTSSWTIDSSSGSGAPFIDQ